MDASGREKREYFRRPAHQRFSSGRNLTGSAGGATPLNRPAIDALTLGDSITPVVATIWLANNPASII
jgi:hypothetical protein